MEDGQLKINGLGLRTLFRRLLNFAELLKDPHAHHDKEKQTRPSAENPHWHPQPIDFFQQFRLLVMHVRTCIVQKELFIFAHRERAAIDQKDNQSCGENAPYDSHTVQSRHELPQLNNTSQENGGAVHN